MKRKLIGGFAVLAIAAMAAWNVNYGSQTKGMSDLALANVEALAQSEIIGDVWDCMTSCFVTQYFNCLVVNSSGFMTAYCPFHAPRIL